MNHSLNLYLYKENENYVELYFNELSTVDGLKAIDSQNAIKITSVGAEVYGSREFITEKEFPYFNKVDELIVYLNDEQYICLIDFVVEIEGIGKMSSHDDGECHFTINNNIDAIEILAKITPDFQTDFIRETLLENQGVYVSIDNENNIIKYATFEEYIKKYC